MRQHRTKLKRLPGQIIKFVIKIVSFQIIDELAFPCAIWQSSTWPLWQIIKSVSFLVCSYVFWWVIVKPSNHVIEEIANKLDIYTLIVHVYSLIILRYFAIGSISSSIHFLFPIHPSFLYVKNRISNWLYNHIIACYVL